MKSLKRIQLIYMNESKRSMLFPETELIIGRIEREIGWTRKTGQLWPSKLAAA